MTTTAIQFIRDAVLIVAITMPFFAIGLLIKVVHKQKELEKKGLKLIEEYYKSIYDELGRK